MTGNRNRPRDLHNKRERLTVVDNGKVYVDEELIDEVKNKNGCDKLLLQLQLHHRHGYGTYHEAEK